MNVPTWFQHSAQIARTEWTRKQRRLDHSRGWRILVFVTMLSVAVGIGSSAYGFGTALYGGQLTVPLDMLRTATTMGSFMLLIMFEQRASIYISHIDRDNHLTTVPVHEVVLGVLLIVFRSVAVPLSLGVAGGVIGFAIGAQSPLSVLTLVITVSSLLTLTTLLGVALCLLVELITTRSPRFNRYKTGLGVIAVGLGIILFVVVNSGLLSSTLLSSWLSVGPATWFVDLGFVGTPVVQSDPVRSMGALAVFIGGSPALMAGVTALASRVWRTEPVSIATYHRSRALIGEGVAERLFAGHVSRPVLTVARKRWLQERRVPFGLTMLTWPAFFLPAVIVPILAAGAVPGISLVLFAFIGATGTGFAFGFSPIETEYSSLPITLTTLSGEQFIRGEILAGNVIGAPVTAVGTVLLALGSPLSILETLLIALGSVALCVCGSTLAVAIGMNVSYHNLFPIPLPFTSATIYTEIGRASFIRMGAMVGLLGLVCLPVFGGYLFSFVSFFVPATPGLGIQLPIAVVRVGTLLLTTGLAVIGSIVAYRRAVRRYDQYTLL